MVQARGIMLKENVKTIGHMIRLYTNKNATLNGTGKIFVIFELFGNSAIFSLYKQRTLDLKF